MWLFLWALSLGIKIALILREGDAVIESFDEGRTVLVHMKTVSRSKDEGLPRPIIPKKSNSSRYYFP